MGIGQWSEENEVNEGRNAGNQVENMGDRGGNAANHCGDVGTAGNQGRIWGIGVAMQGIRLEMRESWGNNKGV